MIRLLFFCVCLLQTVPAKHYHAFKVSAAGKNSIVDPDSAPYESCSLELEFKGNQVLMGQQQYIIAQRERYDDSLSTFFCYRLQGRDSVFCSVTVLPAKKPYNWKILIAWEDSTKAFQTFVRLK